MSVGAGLSIGTLAKATGTKVETIRFYEKSGLLPVPPRTSGNYRAYGEEHIRRLGFVRKARALGFPLDAIRAMLALADQPERACADVDALVRDQLREVERKIADLERLRDELSRLSRQCGSDRRMADCRIIEALWPSGPQDAPDRDGPPPDRQSVRGGR